MAKIKPLKLAFDNPPDADVTHMRVYYAPVADGGLNPNVFDDFAVEDWGDLPDGRKFIDLATISGMAGKDDNYLFGLAAIDDIGNEGDIWQGQHPVDFIAPSAPTNVEFLTQ